MVAAGLLGRWTIVGTEARRVAREIRCGRNLGFLATPSSGPSERQLKRVVRDVKLVNAVEP